MGMDGFGFDASRVFIAFGMLQPTCSLFRNACVMSPDPQQWCPGFVMLSFANAQANNQWNIAAELADDPMDSAFARALRGGIKGVAMVLDREVQPLTRDSTAQGKAQRNKLHSAYIPHQLL